MSQVDHLIKIAQLHRALSTDLVVIIRLRILLSIIPMSASDVAELLGRVIRAEAEAQWPMSHGGISVFDVRDRRWLTTPLDDAVDRRPHILGVEDTELPVLGVVRPHPGFGADVVEACGLTTTDDCRNCGAVRHTDVNRIRVAVVR